MYSLEKGFCGFGRTSKDKLAFGPLSQKRADHSIHCQIPPRDIDEDLRNKQNLKLKLNVIIFCNEIFVK